MPKSRKNKRSLNPQKRKLIEARKAAKHFAMQIPNQQVLANFLLAVDDVWERKAMFDWMSPYLRFSAVFPSTIVQSSGVQLETPGVILEA